MEVNKSRHVLNLYNNSLYTSYNIFITTYVPTKTKGLIVVHEAKGFKQVGELQLCFLTCKNSSTGRLSIKHLIFKKLYDHPAPHAKVVIKETMFNNYLAIELCMEFNVDILQCLTNQGNIVNNVFGSTKSMYSALVSSYTILYTNGQQDCTKNLPKQPRARDEDVGHPIQVGKATEGLGNNAHLAHGLFLSYDY